MLGALRNFVRGEHIGDQPEPGVDWFFFGLRYSYGPKCQL